jgi:hypothetical protein
MKYCSTVNVVAEDVYIPGSDEIAARAGTLIDEGWVLRLEALNVDEMIVRSSISCETRYGVCSNCYGRDLGRGHLVNIGEAVGVIAAQYPSSINVPAWAAISSEPGIYTSSATTRPRIRSPNGATTSPPSM